MLDQLIQITWEQNRSDTFRCFELTDQTDSFSALSFNGWNKESTEAGKLSFYLTVRKLVHASLQVGTSRLRASSDRHGFAVKVVGWWAGLEDVRSHVLGDKQQINMNRSQISDLNPALYDLHSFIVDSKNLKGD